MKHSHFTIAIIFILSLSMHSQSLDTLVDVGGYNLHFNIIKGEGIPILFESGAGNDGSVWNNILAPISKVTGATIITYDRAGFGKSEINLKEKDDSKHGIINSVKELEIGLKKLGYNEKIIVVAHSYGGSIAKLFASRHPNKVKYVVLVDSNPVSAFTDEDYPDSIEKNEKNLGIYYLYNNLRESFNLVEQTEFPSSIPIIDIEAELVFTNDELTLQRFRNAHKEFVNAQPNRIGIRATGSQHYIFLDNPSLVINVIVKAYSSIQPEEQKFETLKLALDNAIELSVETKKREIENLHSEDDLNQWGYTLMRSEELEKALEVFKLNTILYPESWNVYDSYGEALLNSNRKEESIEMYKKSIALNPENENGKEMLMKINQE